MRFIIVADGAIVEGDTYTAIVEALGRRRRFNPPASAADALDKLVRGLQCLTHAAVEAKGLDLETRCESVVRQAEAAGFLQAEECFRCDNCDWSSPSEEDLDPTRNFWERVEVGGTVPAGQCPECGALVYRQERPGRSGVNANVSTYEDLRLVLGELLEWAAGMGGWEADCWVRARRLFDGAEGKRP